MSSFNALNIIPDDDPNIDEENTKEIQIEEALKLYQNAIKLHAQGPSHLAEASDAYLQLFRSEIFQYPESLSDTRFLELYGRVPDQENDYEDIAIEPGAVTNPTGARGGADGAPSTLPQILYLAYKNHGQFMMDYLKSYIIRAKQQNGLAVPKDQVISSAVRALKCFSEALLRDESDAELWRRVSRVSGVLGSQRLVRYCLEAVLDDEGEVAETGLGIEGGYAAHQVKKLLDSVSDDLSFTQPPISQLKHKHLALQLVKRMDPYPYIPASLGPTISDGVNRGPIKFPLDLATPSWATLGKYIWSIVASEQHGHADHGWPQGSGEGILIHLPGGEGQSDEEMMSVDAMEGPETQILGEIAAADSRVRKDSLNNDPTETAVTSDGDIQMGDASTGGDHDREKTHGGSQPSEVTTKKRKSSPESIQGPPDGGRGRSKRIKARESNASAVASAEITAMERAVYFEEKLQVFVDADEYLFDFMNDQFDRLGVQGLGTLNELKTAISDKESSDPPDSAGLLSERKQQDTVIQDLREVLKKWDDDKGNVILYGDGIDDPGGRLQMGAPASSRNAGLVAFLEHAKTGNRKGSSRPLLTGAESLEKFARRINKQCLHSKEVAFQWLEALLLRELPSRNAKHAWRSACAGILGDKQMSSYTRYLWPDVLKGAVVQIIVALDEYAFKRFSKIADIIAASRKDIDNIEVAHTEMAQTIFELHLDIYTSITNPSSEVDLATRIAQKDRLARWCMLVSDLVNALPGAQLGEDMTNPLSFRYLWSCALYATTSEGVSREHVIACFEDLKLQLQSTGDPVIDLPNNALMPEVSAAQAEREISRLKTTDFFLNIFQSQNANPADVIEILEPVLDPQTMQTQGYTSEVEHLQEKKSSLNGVLQDIIKDHPEDGLAVPQNWESLPYDHAVEAVRHMLKDLQPNAEVRLTWEETNGVLADKRDDEAFTPPLPSPIVDQIGEMSKFLERGNASLRLFLWQKLREAYETIDYSPKVFSCYLKSIEIIIREFQTRAYLDSSSEHRQFTLLKWLRALEDLIVRALTLSLNDSRAFDCMDQNHLISSMSALAGLSRLLHSFCLYEDAITVGQIPPYEPFDQAFFQSFNVVTTKLREMQVRTWTLQYALFKEALSQNRELFPEADAILIEFLRVVHNFIGIRSFCKMSNKIVLRFMRVELYRLSHVDGWEQDMAQVLFDLYGLKLGAGTFELQNHGCQPEILDRNTDRGITMQIIDFVLLLVKKVNIKDLARTEYKPIIDKLHQVISYPKQTPSMMHNQRVFDAYIKSSINPLDLNRCLRGVGELSRVTVNAESASLAEKGWYFLNGHMALAKWRSVKRVSSMPPEDINTAIMFFKFDIYSGIDRWETWYRLAQCYDSLLEEEVVWSAETLNNKGESVILLQRHAIHCYVIATATALRTADASAETAKKMSEMLTEFGTRIYASSRPPFDMEAFRISFERPFSGAHGMYTKPGLTELTEYKAWKFASALFRKALIAKPDYWMNYYMLGKCLGKMYNHQDGADVTVHEVIDCFVRAVETVPERKDRQDPIFEPHYKLVSIVHKLVRDKRIEPTEGSNILEATSYAKKIPPSEDLDTWDPYVLSILKKLRTADKANWHHRMIDRAAHIIYDGSSDSLPAAMAARHEFTQQIFTRTMTWQIWKPEFERAGRHFVYTSRYTKFFVRLLEQLNDRTNLEALLKRVRKKPTDFFNHSDVWKHACPAGVRLIRRMCQIPEGHDDVVFKSVTYDDFNTMAQRLENWCLKPNNNSNALTVVRDVIELKKLNNQLWKNTIIDDLAIDAYARLYETVVPIIQAQIAAEPQPHLEPVPTPQHEPPSTLLPERKDPMSMKNLILTAEAEGRIPPTILPARILNPQLYPDTDERDPAMSHPTKQRTRVGRRDILKRAENLVIRPPVHTAHSGRANAPISETLVSRIAASSGGALGPPPTSAPRDEASAQQGTVDTPGRDAETTENNSAAGSVHDSADDESELSEEEVEEGDPMMSGVGESGAASAEGTMTGDEA